MKKSYIYILIVLLVIGGFFFATLDKDKPNNSEVGQGEANGSSENKGKEDGKDQDKEDIKDKTDNGNEDKEEDFGPRNQERAIEIGRRLPDFELKDIDGLEKSLSKYEDQGKIIFLNFWASSCPPCRQEMPDFEKINKEYDDVIVVAVNVEEKSDRNKVDKFLNEGDYNFEILLDDELEVGMEYGIGSLPTTFFIDKNGKFRGLWPGMMTLEQMEEVIDDLREY